MEIAGEGQKDGGRTSVPEAAENRNQGPGRMKIFVPMDETGQPKQAAGLWLCRWCLSRGGTRGTGSTHELRFTANMDWM